MKTTRTLLVVIVLLLASNKICFGDVSEPQERTKSFNVNKGGHLYVNVDPGQITIVPWDKNEVVVKIKGLEEDELNNVKMESSQNNVRVEYESEWGEGDAEFYINVPSQFNLELISSAGDIKVNGNISGEVLAKTSGGELSFKNVNGDLTATTAGGEIRVGDVEGELKINTAGGDITLGTIKGKFVKAVTSGGEIRITKASSGAYLRTSGGDISAGDLGGDSELLTSGGNITVGNVSGSVRMETSGGDLQLSSAKGKIQAKTSGGNINLKNIIGSVMAKTSAGDVDVMLDPSSGSENVISTSVGEIILRIPSSAKTEIDASLRLRGAHRRSREAFKIYSDFPVKESSLFNDSKDVSKAKYIINGGGSKISINATESGIKILKSDK